MKSVAFVANYHLTDVFLAISGELYGVDVYWFVVSIFDKERLCHAGVKEDRIIYIPMTPVCESFIYGHCDIAFNELIFSDRVLRHKPKEARRYLEFFAVRVDDALSRLKLSVIFGESTWSHERIIGKISKRYNVYYLTPHTIRFPTGRFGFFEGERQESLFDIGNHIITRDNFKFPVWEKPNYVQMNDEILRNKKRVSAKIARLRNFITKVNIDSNSPTNGTSFWTRLVFGTAEEINKLMYRFVPKLTLLDITGQRYFLYALHKQPESSIDVMGRFYEDQFKNIEVLHRCLPSQCKLVVKEHTNAIGDRSFSFYKKVRQLEDVVLVHENSDTHALIKSSLGVFTVSGTIAYEAAFLGVQSFTFVEMFFNILPKCNHITFEMLREIDTLEDLLFDSTDLNEDAILSIINCSHEGVFTDVVTVPNVLESENKLKLVSAFLRVIDFCIANVGDSSLQGETKISIRS